ncbi:YbaB/EbfC family nucleoid-associated protein [Dehalogenimonas alkenigignens]|jgi:nucleoid-associated protein EbfC|uniref:Nucleoid-associated protein DEALK_16500 n=1 Tax=Dehalogenimonas alkenigignens TaxID=1217799 RepID=A0A0W0GJV4_9CHLR|nr:YbaB/EbfC family nucleoid-associated protein [Dehalogenimonas alkenigignens]KTB48803.1 DNA-binding protein, YbaB/EbfC family [Dehalogenimonas alkenigignens]PVV84787.1 nucleoid-associated protein, YbaB/EbfC family [Dehalogenimonas alkenigignens]
MDFSKVKQAMELKQQLDKIQKELAKIIVEAERGPVKVTANGQQKLISITINPEAVIPAKTKQLEDNILKTINDAMEKAKKESSKQMAGMMGGMGLPGLG